MTEGAECEELSLNLMSHNCRNMLQQAMHNNVVHTGKLFMSQDAHR